MDWTTSIIICVVALVLWIAATVGENRLRQKRRDRMQKQVKDGGNDKYQLYYRSNRND